MRRQSLSSQFGSFSECYVGFRSRLSDGVSRGSIRDGYPNWLLSLKGVLCANGEVAGCPKFDTFCEFRNFENVPSEGKGLWNRTVRGAGEGISGAVLYDGAGDPNLELLSLPYFAATPRTALKIASLSAAGKCCFKIRSTSVEIAVTSWAFIACIPCSVLSRVGSRIGMTFSRRSEKR
jgi:hypothetical protein